MKKVSLKDLKIDLPVLAKDDSWINVEYNGVCVYVGHHYLGHCLIVLESTDLNPPVYKGGFSDLYIRKGDSLKKVLNNII